MIDMSSDNTFQLKAYTIDYHRDSIKTLLISGEVIWFSFYNDNDSIKVFISDKRIIIEQGKDITQYTFIGLNTLDFLQMELEEVSRQVSGVSLVFGLRNGQELKFIIEDEINPVKMHAILASEIFK